MSKFFKIKKFLIIAFFFLVFSPVKALALVELSQSNNDFYEIINYTNSTGSINDNNFVTIRDSIESYIGADLVTYNKDYYFIQFDFSTTNLTSTSYTARVIYFDDTDLANWTIETYADYSQGNGYSYNLRFRNNIGSTPLRIFSFDNFTTLEPSMNITTTWASGTNITLFRQWYNPTNIVSIPSNYMFYATNAYEALNNKVITKINSPSNTNQDIFVNGVTYVNNNQSFKIDTIFDTPIIDTTAPTLDFSGITLNNGVYESVIKETFMAPSPIASDDVDGDISQNIVITSNVNNQILGNYNLHYEICDSSNNCTTYDLPVEIIDGLTEIDLTGKYAALFYFKNRSILEKNATCTKDFLGNNTYTPCYLQNFKFMGYYKFGTVNLPISDDLIFEDYTKNWTTLEFEKISYDKFSDLGQYFYQETEDFAILYYNANIYKTAKIRYNADVFDVKIFDDKFSTIPQNLDYIDKDGVQQNDTIISPPKIDIEYLDDRGIFEKANAFLSEKNAALISFKNYVDELWNNLPIELTIMLSSLYALFWVYEISRTLRR